MIACLKGIVFSKKPEGIIIDVSGIGYHVSVPLCSLADIPDPGQHVFLHTYTHVKEDVLQLFGFLTEEERRVFTTLISINGVGPRLALAILSGMPVQRLVETIENEEVSLLSSIPGLGSKTAARIVLELKGKLTPSGDQAHAGIGPSATGDAISALVNLGYKKSVSEKAVQKASHNGCVNIEDLIKEALRHLTEKK